MANALDQQNRALGQLKKRYITAADGPLTGLDAYAAVPMEADTRLAAITDASIADSSSVTRLLAVTSLAAPHYGQISAITVSSGTICLYLN